jgi:hypothetical protein
VSNVVTLFGVRTPEHGAPNDHLVQMLEEMLGMAKSGQLQSFVANGFTSEGNCLGLWVDTHLNVYEMYGTLCALSAEYVRRHPELID